MRKSRTTHNDLRRSLIFNGNYHVATLIDFITIIILYAGSFAAKQLTPFFTLSTIFLIFFSSFSQFKKIISYDSLRGGVSVSMKKYFNVPSLNLIYHAPGHHGKGRNFHLVSAATKCKTKRLRNLSGKKLCFRLNLKM